jgi:hypothetical protein
MLKNLVENKYEVFSMANLSSATTGVKGAIIWVSVGEFSGKKSEHEARIKVVEGSSMSSNLENAAVITIEESPKVLHGKIKKKVAKDSISFVTLNKKPLLDYWNGKIDTAVFISRLKPISS